MEWLSNVVPVLKNNGKLSVRIDFGDINKTILIDEDPIPMVDILVDSASDHEILSFMEGHSGYNQIFITDEDVSKTAFRCLGAIGTFQWVVMPFGLKNARPTYQRPKNTIFYNLIGKRMEV